MNQVRGCRKQDYRDGNGEIYYKRSSNGGNTWGNDVRLINASATSFNPAITSDANGLHVVWRDERDGNDEIYYKRGTFTPTALTIDLILNGTSFETGETVTIDVKAINPGSAMATDVKIWVELSDGDYLPIITLYQFTIPEGTIGPINLVILNREPNCDFRQGIFPPPTPASGG